MRVNGAIQLYPFVRIVVCLIVGIVIGDATIGCVPLFLWQWLFVALLAALVTLYLSNRGAIIQTILLFLLVTVGGAWRMANCGHSLECSFSGADETYEAVVLEHPVEKPHSYKCELAIVGGRLAGHRVNAYFQKPSSYGESEGTFRLKAGDGIVARSVFTGFDDSYATHRGGFDMARQRMVRGISARTFVASADWQHTEVSVGRLPYTDRLSLALQPLRAKLLSQLRGSAVSDEAYATIAAMTLGDKTSLTAELRDTYSKAGVSHVLALSGLHLGIIFAMITLLLGRLRNTIVGYAVTLLSVWLFVVLVGMQPGIVRSATMFTLYASMTFASHENNTLNSLAVAASTMLVASPVMLWDVGYQMSFLAVLGIVLCMQRLRSMGLYRFSMRHRMLGKLLSLLTVSVAAQVFVLPLVMYYFGRVPLYFLLSNIIVVPATTLIVYASVLLFVSSPLCAVADGVATVWQWMAGRVGWLVDTMNGMLGALASLPGASVDGVYINLAQLSIVYLLTAALFGCWYYIGKLPPPTTP